MPKAFDNCVKSGGKVRTLKGPSKQYDLEKGQYRHVCFKNGEVHLGHVKTKESK